MPGRKNWSEFVKFPYLLKYLNTKHVTYSENRGLFLEQGCYAKQISVNDEHLFQILKQNEGSMLKMNYWVGKDHSGNDNWVLVTDNIVWIGIWYDQKIDDSKQPVDQCYIVRLQKKSCKTPEEHKTALQPAADEFEFLSPDDNRILRFAWNEKDGYYMLKVPFPKRNDFQGAASTIMKLLEKLFTSRTSLNSWK